MTAVSMQLGKMRGLQRMANETGHFTMVALDQRPPIAQILAAGLGIPATQVRFDDMVAAKRVLVETLGSHASAMLLDPNFALPAALDCLPARTGLMVTLEDHRFQDTPGGRLSHSIADWSVEKIKRAGGDGVKVLAWYRPDAAAQVLAHQRAYVQQVGDECRRHDIPYVLELLTYPLAQAPSVTEAPEQGAQRVIDSVREFVKPQYGVDLLKLESPLPGRSLPATDGLAAHRAAQRWFDDMGQICREARVPWVMLSAGVTPAQFSRVMRYAYAAGANGFLAGRAIWASALQHFPDLIACREVLCTEAIQTLQGLVDGARQAGRPWTPDFSGLDRIRAEGDLCAHYA
jgi:tagatose 1,6-diphosphate aldolase